MFNEESELYTPVLIPVTIGREEVVSQIVYPEYFIVLIVSDISLITVESINF